MTGGDASWRGLHTPATSPLSYLISLFRECTISLLLYPWLVFFIVVPTVNDIDRLK